MTAKRRNVMLRWILAGLGLVGSGYLALGLIAWQETKPESIPIRVPALIEASGLAPSHRTSDLLWSQNDSGGQPVLYGFGTDGAPRGMIRIAGIKNLDWEAISSFEMEGKAWIAIGDIGNNSSRRTTLVIRVIEEPSAEQLTLLRETTVPVAWNIPFRFDTTPRDCEALLVDAEAGELLLISKRTDPPEIYLLPLRPPPGSGVLLAKKIGTVTHLPQPNLKEKLFPVPTGRFLAEITDGAIAPNRRSVAILTYGNVLVFERENDESWSSTFQRTPLQLPSHGLQQAEAICFSRDGKELFAAGEQKHPVLVHFLVPNHPPGN